MSSPLASPGHSPFRSATVGLHQRLSHHRRVALLADLIAEVIAERFPAGGEIRCLDVGCGDARVSDGVQRLLPRTSWHCVDLYEVPEALAGEKRWRNYRRFDGRHIPFADRSHDVALLCDVLHHAGDERTDLLREAGRVARLVLVKDHFEYSAWSRMMLRLMDFAGNWGYAVRSPGRYMRREGFGELCAAAGLKQLAVTSGIDLYAHLPLLGRLLRPQWQFMAVLAAEG